MLSAEVKGAIGKDPELTTKMMEYRLGREGGEGQSAAGKKLIEWGGGKIWPTGNG